MNGVDEMKESNMHIADIDRCKLVQLRQDQNLTTNDRDLGTALLEPDSDGVIGSERTIISADTNSEGRIQSRLN